MIVEKVYKCCTFYEGWRGIENLTLTLANDIKNGYHIMGMERDFSISVNTAITEPDLIITLRKGLNE